MSTSTPAQMPLCQALALALVLIDFELEQPQVQPPPEDWERELKLARAAIEQALRPQIPAPFWPVPERKGRKLRGAAAVG